MTVYRRNAELGFPEPFTLAGFEGSLGEYIEQVHWQYRCIVSDARIRLWGRPVFGSDRKASDGREQRFWHLITTGHRGDRRLSLARCALMPEVWALLELLAVDDIRVCWWRQGQALHVAPVNFSFHVVLGDRRDSWELLSAWPLGRRWDREHVTRQAAAAWLSGTCRAPDDRHTKWRGSRLSSHLTARQLLVLQGGRV